MKENKYDERRFFNLYSQMSRSVLGLEGAGEWHILKKMFPDFTGKRVLDLGCGFGWHSQYAAENGAESVTGIDLSSNMIEKANEMNRFPCVKYYCTGIEDFRFEREIYDVVVSSLAFHYLESFHDIASAISECLVPGGTFVFSAEHPVFTAYGSQDWYYDDNGKKLHWPVDRYFDESRRKAIFLGEEVTKFHKTIATYMKGLLENGFEITGFEEPKPDPKFLETIPEMKDELRRPMFILISAKKRK